MRLIDTLEQRVARETSYFQAQLLREDIARLKTLEALAQNTNGLQAFVKAGMRLGWTAGDARTHEIKAPLEALLAAVYAGKADAGVAEDARIEAAWIELHRVRMEKLLGCLSTPVPKPVD